MKQQNDWAMVPNVIEDPIRNLLSNIMSWTNAPAVNGTPALGAANTGVSSFTQGLLNQGMGFPANTASIVPNAGYNPSAWEGAFGYTNKAGNQVNGWAPQALSALAGLGQSWLGMQQLDLAKDQFAFQKDTFAKNWDAQARTTNAALEDQQSARIASKGTAGPGSYRSVGDYMNQYGVKV